MSAIARIQGARDSMNITCACGNHQLCLDGLWRGRVYRNGKWDLMRDGAKKCARCGDELKDREAA